VFERRDKEAMVLSLWSFRKLSLCSRLIVIDLRDLSIATVIKPDLAAE